MDPGLKILVRARTNQGNTVLYKLGTLNFITSFYFMVLEGRLRTDTITFFRDSNCLLSDVLHFQRDLGYVGILLFQIL